MKKLEMKKMPKDSELTTEKAKIEFGKRMNDFVLVPVKTKKKIKKDNR